jgi:hypothetical protein
MRPGFCRRGFSHRFEFAESPEKWRSLAQNWHSLHYFADNRLEKKGGGGASHGQGVIKGQYISSRIAITL